MLKRFFQVASITCLLSLTVACATSPTGRSQFTLFNEQQLAQMGSASFDQLKQEEKVLKHASTRNYVQCITDQLLRANNIQGSWEVEVFDSPTPNAFALPGGKIGVYKGMVDLAETPDQLAAVIGHEIAHVVAKHGNERVSADFATQMGVAVLSGILANRDKPNDQLLAALGIGTQVGILLPFSRQHETEADLIGLDLMARAGFDPRQSVNLWQNMAAKASAAPVEFLSTHPGPNNRIRTLENAMPSAIHVYEQAIRSGQRPNCRKP